MTERDLKSVARGTLEMLFSLEAACRSAGATMPTYTDLQGGWSAQELMEFMAESGLRFAAKADQERRAEEMIKPRWGN